MLKPPLHFSQRTDFGAESDALMDAVSRRRRAGLPVLDLTESNPTRCGLGLPAERVLPALASEANLHYAAEPFGPLATRAAVCESYLAPRGVVAAPEHLMLTASTSEAYSYLFRLLCEPGDHVLVPQPSYPLFDLLARLGDVQTRAYPLRFHEQWEIDLEALAAAITERTRAIVVVHPNNPTGHYASASERAALDRLAAERGLPLLIDEVFLDYPLAEGGSDAAVSFAAQVSCEALTFVMSGFSKVLALPQMKLGWTLVRGPEALRAEALHRQEYIADTFLSVAAPAANAAATWLAEANTLQRAVRDRLRQNLKALDAELARQTLVTRLPVQSGWSVLLRVPAIAPDGDLALDLLHAEGVLVHPGSFFALPPRGWLVVSLLLSTTEFTRGIRALLQHVERTTLAR